MSFSVLSVVSDVLEKCPKLVIYDCYINYYGYSMFVLGEGFRRKVRKSQKTCGKTTGKATGKN